MKFQNLSVKRLFGRVAIGLVLSMSGITTFESENMRGNKKICEVLPI